MKLTTKCLASSTKSTTLDQQRQLQTLSGSPWAQLLGNQYTTASLRSSRLTSSSYRTRDPMTQASMQHTCLLWTPREELVSTSVNFGDEQFFRRFIDYVSIIIWLSGWFPGDHSIPFMNLTAQICSFPNPIVFAKIGKEDFSYSAVWGKRRLNLSWLAKNFGVLSVNKQIGVNTRHIVTL